MVAYTLKTVTACQAMQHDVPEDFNPHVESITFINLFQVCNHLKAVYGFCLTHEARDNSWQGQGIFSILQSVGTNLWPAHLVIEWIL